MSQRCRRSSGGFGGHGTEFTVAGGGLCHEQPGIGRSNAFARCPTPAELAFGFLLVGHRRLSRAETSLLWAIAPAVDVADGFISFTDSELAGRYRASPKQRRVATRRLLDRGVLGVAACRPVDGAVARRYFVRTAFIEECVEAARALDDRLSLDSPCSTGWQPGSAKRPIAQVRFVASRRHVRGLDAEGQHEEATSAGSG